MRPLQGCRCQRLLTRTGLKLVRVSGPLQLVADLFLRDGALLRAYTGAAKRAHRVVSRSSVYLHRLERDLHAAAAMRPLTPNWTR